MAFDVLRFLEQNGIEYAKGGANTSRNNVTVHCPFCGPADPSKHMSINLVNKGWRCWRHPQHRGKNPARLVQALLRCPWERAMEIVGQAIFVPTDFMDRVRREVAPTPLTTTQRKLKLPKEFRAFAGKPSARPYENYLVKDRGFDWADVDRMTYKYDVRYCTRGPYRGRIIFPIYFMGELVAWTGRTLDRNNPLRYKALSVDEEKAESEGYHAAIGPISHYLLWFDDLVDADADTIILCEGPFDALKIDVLGRRDGIRATCFFTSSPTDAQIALLHELCPQYKQRVLLLDSKTLALGLRVVSSLKSLGVVRKELSTDLKDPGEFDINSFRKFALSLRRR